jgi:hypothetical protein
MSVTEGGFVYGDYVSKYTGPYWRMTMETLEFDMPFTGERVVYGPAVTWSLTWIASLLFVLLIKFVAPKCKPSDPKLQKKIEFVHFFSLCIFSAIACGSTIYLLFSRDEFTDLDGYLCNPVPDWYRFVSILFTLSKVWEWLDTFILVWNGKSIQQIGFLHFYHHMSTLFLFSFTMNFPGTEKIGLLLNGFVHTLMYAHYSFRLPKMFRPIITIAQIIQLFLGTLSHHINITTCQEFSGYIEQYPFSYMVPYLFVPVYLGAFCRFFWQTYISAPAPKAPVKKD